MFVIRDGPDSLRGEWGVGQRLYSPLSVRATYGIGARLLCGSLEAAGSSYTMVAGDSSAILRITCHS